MYHVLMPVDTDEDRARKQARFVADLPAAEEEVEATVLFVFGKEDQEAVPDELQRFKSADRVGSVRRASEILNEQGVTHSIRDMSGQVSSAILSFAEEAEPNLIVLGGRKRSPVGKAIFGSVAQEVILNSDRPVVVTGE